MKVFQLFENEQLVMEKEWSVFDKKSDNTIFIHLKKNKYHRSPVKSIYKMVIKDGDEEIVTFNKVLFDSYEVLMDNGTYQGEEETEELRYTYNFFKFIIIEE
jgi:hypothetical protein